MSLVVVPLALLTLGGASVQHPIFARSRLVRVVHRVRMRRYSYRQMTRLLRKLHLTHREKKRFVYTLYNSPSHQIERLGRIRVNSTPAEKLAASAGIFRSVRRKRSKRSRRAKAELTVKAQARDDPSGASAQMYANDSYAQDFDQQTLSDVNQERQADGLRPLRVSAGAQKVADLRIGPYLSHSYSPVARALLANSNYNGEADYSHGVTDGTSSFDILRQNPQIRWHWVGENAGPLFKGNEDLSAYGQGDYYNADGAQNADNTNDSMMNHDDVYQNGHRNNILSPKYTQIGIASQYNGNGDSSFVEEFLG